MRALITDNQQDPINKLLKLTIKLDPNVLILFRTKNKKSFELGNIEGLLMCLETGSDLICTPSFKIHR